MKIRTAVLLVLALATGLPAGAAIVGGSVTGGSAQAAGGTFVKLTIPLANPFGPADSVGNDNFQSPNLFGFDEAQNVTLSSALSVDVGLSPIAAGTIVSSQYIFFDPGPSERVVGTVDFDADVLAIITSTGLLASSDFLAAAGVNYLDLAQRRLEVGDSVTISGARQILFDTVGSSPGDYVRVITAASGKTSVPEPSSLFLLGFALLLLGVVRYRRRPGG